LSGEPAEGHTSGSADRQIPTKFGADGGFYVHDTGGWMLHDPRGLERHRDAAAVSLLLSAALMSIGAIAGDGDELLIDAPPLATHWRRVVVRQGAERQLRTLAHAGQLSDEQCAAAISVVWSAT